MKKIKQKLKIAVAMSGGVDSSVAAKLLKDQGHEVVGIFLHFWKESKNIPLDKGGKGDYENKCCSAQALLDARRVADKIGIPLYTLNFAKIFKKQVVDNFLSEYSRGKTPNSCVRCNKLVKLGFLIKQAKKLGFDYVATGHYARVKKTKKQENKKTELIYKLLKARDENKDQSYFLYTFSQDELKHLLFPLGNFIKPQVRQLAKKFKLPTAEKAESQEVCFIPDKDHNEFLKRHLKLKPGKTLSLLRRGEGEVLGRHDGLPLYTIGQRKGIKIGGTGPYYAAKMDYKKNILYVVNKSDDPLLYKNELLAKNVSWISDAAPKLPLKCQAVIRYHHTPAECIITKIKPSTIHGKVLGENNFKIKFLKPQRAITPGQSVVFYRSEETLGGGVIM